MKRVCIVGASGKLGRYMVQHALDREEVDAEVKRRIEVVGKGGGYMISSANSITDYCKLENVWAMSRAIGKYRTYR